MGLSANNARVLVRLHANVMQDESVCVWRMESGGKRLASFFLFGGALFMIYKLLQIMSERVFDYVASNKESAILWPRIDRGAVTWCQSLSENKVAVLL
jgi:hypothetical protein